MQQVSNRVYTESPCTLIDLNRTEHVTAVTVAVKDKLTLSIGVAVGSSIVR